MRPPAGEPAGAAGVGAGSGAGAGSAGASSAAGGPEARYASTSFRVILPPSPVPLNWETSTSFSLMSLRTTGERRLGFASVSSGSAKKASTSGSEGSGFFSASAGAGSAAFSSSAGAFFGRVGRLGGLLLLGRRCRLGGLLLRCRCLFGSFRLGRLLLRRRPPPRLRLRSRPIGVPTETVSPSFTRISRMVPAAGDGTSVSTLSVDISTRTSSSAIVSPTCLAQRRMVPSVTVSPSCGIDTVVAKVAPLSEDCGRRRT